MFNFLSKEISLGFWVLESSKSREKEEEQDKGHNKGAARRTCWTADVLV